MLFTVSPSQWELHTANLVLVGCYTTHLFIQSSLDAPLFVMLAVPASPLCLKTYLHSILSLIPACV